MDESRRCRPHLMGGGGVRSISEMS
jgi:hypothetical protein